MYSLIFWRRNWTFFRLVFLLDFFLLELFSLFSFLRQFPLTLLVFVVYFWQGFILLHVANNIILSLRPRHYSTLIWSKTPQISFQVGGFSLLHQDKTAASVSIKYVTLTW
jgi:hypothetical protein